MYLAHVEEGLGTKNLVADAMFELTGKPWDGRVAQCNTAMAFNDIIGCGARIVSYALHLAENDSRLLKHPERTAALIDGTRVGCTIAGATWAGGETPTLRGIIVEGTYLLSGSAIGIVKPKDRLIRGNIKHSDAIVVLHSSGIHANGLSLARKIAERLPKGYLTELPMGQSYGEALLEATVIYAPAVYALLNAGVDIHYATNITGHAWAKLMRHRAPFTYLVGEMPPCLPIFPFMQEHGGIDDREMHRVFNMGGGMALIVDSAGANMEKLIGVLNGLDDRGLPRLVRLDAGWAGRGGVRALGRALTQEDRVQG